MQAINSQRKIEAGCFAVESLHAAAVKRSLGLADFHLRKTL